ncbi:hypothetical protein [Streptomyces mirabilis]|uniref:hypothetical protein n=1 Tax=Streptomyces mirabilis TaxID=68239 RepID=UPI0036DE4B76
MSTEPRTVAVNVHVIKSLEIDESDCLAVMRHSVKMRTVDLLARLENLAEDYGDWDAERLAK